MEMLEMNEDQVREALAKGLFLFEEMGASGDIKTVWDPTKADEVEEARRQFERLIKEKKYRAYRVEGRNGNKGDPLDEFDATAARIIFVPPMAGG